MLCTHPLSDPFEVLLMAAKSPGEWVLKFSNGDGEGGVLLTYNTILKIKECARKSLLLSCFSKHN